MISPEYLAAERSRMSEREFAAQYLCSFEEAEDQVFREDLIERAFVDSRPLWSDFSADCAAQYHYDADVGQWRRAEDLLLGKPKRTPEDIERDINRAICGAPGFDPDRLIREYDDAKREQEALGHGG